MHKCVLKCRPFNQSEYIFIVGQLRAWAIRKTINYTVQIVVRNTNSLASITFEFVSAF